MLETIELFASSVISVGAAGAIYVLLKRSTSFSAKVESAKKTWILIVKSNDE